MDGIPVEADQFGEAQAGLNREQQQGTVAAAADEIVKLRSRAQGEKRDSAESRAEELHIREKFGLLEDTPLHDVTRRGSPLL